MWRIGVKDIKERLRVLNLLVLLLPDVHKAVLKVSFFYMFCVLIHTVTQLHTIMYMFYYMTIYYMLYVSNELTVSSLWVINGFNKYGDCCIKFALSCVDIRQWNECHAFPPLMGLRFVCMIFNHPTNKCNSLWL